MSFRKMVRKLCNDARWHYETKRTRLLWGWRLGRLGHGSVIEPGVRIKSSKNLRIGDNVRLCRGALILTVGEDDYIQIGDSSYISRQACLDAAGGFVEVGNSVYIGAHTVVGGHGGCSIGNDCQIAAYCYIIAANHKFDDLSAPIRMQGYEKQGIKIGENCWMGNGVSVLDGVTVGSGSVLAARCVLTKNTEPDSVMVGVPARLLRKRGLT